MDGKARPAAPDPRLLRRFPTIQSFRAAARRRLPRFAFDFLDGAVGEELAAMRNIRALEEVVLAPRFGLDVSEVATEVELLGRRWSSPIGVAPVGSGNLYWPGGEEALAAAAQAANIPFCLSTTAISPIEKIARIAPDVLWFQLYHLTDMRLTEDLVRRAEACGVKALVLTMDLSTTSKRNRDVANGFTTRFNHGPAFYLRLATAPLWSLAMLRAGPPYPGSLARYGPSGVSPAAAAAAVWPLVSTSTTWEHARRVREIWKGRLVLKGLLRADDCEKAVALGADAVVVSNHGGRQFDAAPAPIDALPSVVAAVGAKVPVLFDGGVRGGLDVLKGLVRGASMVFSGRSFYYGTAALGPRGGVHALSILHLELQSNMRQMGVRSIEEMRAAGPWEVSRLATG
jgi:L-lactate dehydrogenase (cytochrome)